MTEEELGALIGRGEDQRAEFKAAEGDAADIAQAIVAMANSGGSSGARRFCWAAAATATRIGWTSQHHLIYALMHENDADPG